MKNIIICIIFTLCVIKVISQDKSNIETPYEWGVEQSAEVLSELPVYNTPPINIEELNREDSFNDKGLSNLWRFGQEIEVNLNINNAGSFFSLPNGDRVWRAIISCEDALSVSLLFENFHLPSGAKLFLYDTERTNYVGAYTNKNNRNDGLLGTEIVSGSDVIVEYYEPAEVRDLGEFTISTVVHGYREVSSILANSQRGVNDSGDCQVDVNCPEGDGWENASKSTAMIIIAGATASGTLMNNTCNNGLAYFTTAYHNYAATTEVDPGFWAFRFNWETVPGTESCATFDLSVDPGEPYMATAYGATFLETNALYDFILLKIDNMDVLDALQWDLYYSGWDASDEETATEVACISHPHGDLKKIAGQYSAPYKSSGFLGTENWVANWDYGNTLPGSSGSGLVDQSNRFLGVLASGVSVLCQGTTTTPQDSDGYYTRFGIVWDHLGLSQYLAPEGCASSIINDGWSPDFTLGDNDAGILNIVSPNGIACDENSFVPTISLRNYGLNQLTSVGVNYSIDNGVVMEYEWEGSIMPGEIEEIELPMISVDSGEHVFTAYTSTPNGSVDFNSFNDSSTSSFNAIVSGINYTIEIDTDCHGHETTWEIVDADEAVVASGGPYVAGLDIGGFEVHTFCLPTGCYEFKLYDSAGNGMTGVSDMIPIPCGFVGYYSIYDTESNVEVASMLADNGSFGDIEINPFCIGAVSLPENILLTNNHLFDIYPNPSANGLFQLTFVNVNEIHSVSVFDIIGKRVNQAESIKADWGLDMSNSAEGIYLIRVSGEFGTESKIVVIDK